MITITASFKLDMVLRLDECVQQAATLDRSGHGMTLCLPRLRYLLYSFFASPEV